ncbi:MAG TPA: hypothetical protein VEL31_11880, partial [Ktedonobacteraceae bacterium]|nr:hypothetical protein [Ktedonobacteraceae bacterium]
MSRETEPMKRTIPVLDRSRIKQARSVNIDTGALVSELQARVSGEVRFDDGSRALYATDGSNYRQPPIGVVIPRDIDDVLQTVALCHQYGAPL